MPDLDDGLRYDETELANAMYLSTPCEGEDVPSAKLPRIAGQPSAHCSEGKGGPGLERTPRQRTRARSKTPRDATSTCSSTSELRSHHKSRSYAAWLSLGCASSARDAALPTPDPRPSAAWAQSVRCPPASQAGRGCPRTAKFRGFGLDQLWIDALTRCSRRCSRSPSSATVHKRSATCWSACSRVRERS